MGPSGVSMVARGPSAWVEIRVGKPALAASDPLPASTRVLSKSFQAPAGSWKRVGARLMTAVRDPSFSLNTCWVGVVSDSIRVASVGARWSLSTGLGGGASWPGWGGLVKSPVAMLASTGGAGSEDSAGTPGRLGRRGGLGRDRDQGLGAGHHCDRQEGQHHGPTGVARHLRAESHSGTAFPGYDSCRWCPPGGVGLPGANLEGSLGRRLDGIAKLSERCPNSRGVVGLSTGWSGTRALPSCVTRHTRHLSGAGSFPIDSGRGSCSGRREGLLEPVVLKSRDIYPGGLVSDRQRTRLMFRAA